MTQQSILDHPIISSRYFFPRRVEVPEPFWVENGPVRLSCYYHHPHAEGKTIIFFHGNGEVVSDYLELYIPAFDQWGYNCLLAEYRGYAMSSGTPALAAMLEDVRAVIDATGQPLDKLVLFGRSIGSLYAVHGVSMFPDIAGLIIESGISDILERVLLRVRPEEMGSAMIALEEETKRVFNHQEKLAGFKGSTLVLHAENDSLVNVRHGRRLYDWAPERKKIHIFPRGDHNDILMANIEEYLQLLYQFLSSL